MDNKICSKCKKRKPLSEFHKCKSRKDGHKFHCKKCRIKYTFEHKKEIKEYHKIWYQKNKEKHDRQTKQYFINHKKEMTEYKKRYDKLNRYKINKQRKNRLKNNINFKISTNLRILTNHALKGKNKSKSIMKLIGCSLENLKSYLQMLFKKDMTWANYGRYGWHVDHIKPCCSFDLTNPSEQLKCFHYTNLQPLWAEENKKKGRTYDKSSI